MISSETLRLSERIRNYQHSASHSVCAWLCRGLCLVGFTWLRVCSAECVHVLIVLYHGMVNIWNGFKYQLPGSEPSAATAAGHFPFFSFLPVHFFLLLCPCPLIFLHCGRFPLIGPPSSFILLLCTFLDLSFKQLQPLLVWLRWCRISHVCSPPRCRNGPRSGRAGNMLLLAWLKTMWLCLSLRAFTWPCVQMRANHELLSHHTRWKWNTYKKWCVSFLSASVIIV